MLEGAIRGATCDSSGAGEDAEISGGVKSGGEGLAGYGNLTNTARLSLTQSPCDEIVRRPLSHPRRNIPWHQTRVSSQCIFTESWKWKGEMTGALRQVTVFSHER
jgi:hypothetical protein